MIPAQSLPPPESWKEQPPGIQMGLGTDSEEGPCTLLSMRMWCVYESFLRHFHQGVYFPKVIATASLVHVCVLSHFSRVWLCDPMDCSPPGSFVHRVFQATIQEWIAISFSRGSSQPRAWTRSPASPELADEIFMHWAIWKAHFICIWSHI